MTKASEQVQGSLAVDILHLLQELRLATSGELLGRLLNTRPCATREQLIVELQNLTEQNLAVERYTDTWSLP